MPDRALNPRGRLVDFRARERAPALPPEDPIGPRDHPRGRPGEGLRGPRDRRGVPGRGQGAAAGAVAGQPALVGREPAPVRMLARAADAEGRERLRPLRPAAARDRRRRIARGALVAALVACAAMATGCGGDDPTVGATHPRPAATAPTTT